MSYLLDKKIRRKKFLQVFVIFCLLFFLIYFRSDIFNGLSFMGQIIFRPVLILGNNIGEKFSNISSFFYSKNILLENNTNLRLDLNEKETMLSNYNSILAENIQMKEILGRKIEKTNMVISAILSKPNRSLYDTLIIDTGTKDSISEGKRVFAFGNIPIGRIVEVYSDSSKVILFSSPGEKTEVVVSKDIFMQVIGRGGGNFEMNLVKDIVLERGMEVILPGIHPYVLGIVETVISDPREFFQKVLLVSPVNIQELKFVEIEK